ncbi:manganese/zinc/iron transport system ATP-binding protein [Austwickia chelonae]|uniref:Putative ABC transporter ATP-binding protein n=1 Tax=Austwickia chelonae NBRC 105200 TaxID=1184607 RepID=K6V9U4_9MICO|nr:metal ABC transporter ATP-binding protein [Austwickia chelonae]GAB78983.1 putative ABC transporter ATP-binding protein [Austwickia chelonae NBRC 105200]SEV87796.1 manganese/zinc/iron transport system ATP-binding protein [Austwickia chelonae]
MDTAPACRIHDLSVAYHEDLVLERIDIAVTPGKITAVVGPNGAGKSTLLKAALGLVPAVAGHAEFFGQPFPRVRRRVGYMPQAASVDWDYPATVRTVVTMGTYGRLGWFRRPGAKEHQACEDALAHVGLSDLAHRQIGQLSGGQRQRTFLARILAQDPDLYLMDEPLAGVDTASGLAILDVLAGLRDRGKTVVLVHHDLDLVREFCDDAVLLATRQISAGSVEEALSAEYVESAYHHDGQHRLLEAVRAR